MLKPNLNTNRFTMVYKSEPSVIYTYIPPVFDEPPVICWIDKQGNINAGVATLASVFKMLRTNCYTVLEVLKD